MNNKFSEELINGIPEKFVKSFTKRAIRDAEKILDINDPKFNDVAYAIFKGYNLGFSLGILKKSTEKTKLEEVEEIMEINNI
jgi:hypothetical protein